MSLQNGYWPEPSSVVEDNLVNSEAFARRVGARRAVVGILAVAVVLGIWLLAVRTHSGQLLDTLSMLAVKDRFDLGGSLSFHLARGVSEPTLVAVSVVAFAVAAFRRRLSLGVRVVLMLVISNGVTQILKAVLLRPDLEVGHSLVNSFPSGHVTAIASLGVALVAVVPLRGRGIAAVLAFLVTSLVGIAVMGLAWHRPSDVIGSLGIVLASAMLTLPSEWSRNVSNAGASIAAAFSVLAALGGSAALAMVFRDLPYRMGPVTQQQIADLAQMNSPGLIAGLASCLLTVSATVFLFVSVKTLAGGERT